MEKEENPISHPRGREGRRGKRWVCLGPGGAVLAFLILVLLVAACANNPKTRNKLLRNKRIAWVQDNARYHEFLADGRLVAVGGEYPLEGYGGMSWEAINETGSFKVIPDLASPDTYLLAILSEPPAVEERFQFEHYEHGKSIGKEKQSRRITDYGELKEDHGESATETKAMAMLTRYRDDVYVYRFEVEDPLGAIERVVVSGAFMETANLVLKEGHWLDGIPIILPSDAPPKLPLLATMVIHYKGGEQHSLTFETMEYRDQTRQMFDDSWF